MPDPKIETEVERLKAKALARWESEGGALAASKSDQALAASRQGDVDRLARRDREAGT